MSSLLLSDCQQLSSGNSPLNIASPTRAAAAGGEEDEALELAAAVRARFLGAMVAMSVSLQSLPHS